MQTPERKLVTFEDVERRLMSESRKPYFDWLRHIVTLALAALTALVALQGHYVPLKPKLPMFLAIGWCALAVAIFCGVFALRSEYITPLAAAKKWRKLRQELGDEAVGRLLNSNTGTQPHWSHKWSVRIMVISFVVAVASICCFAIVNLAW